MAVVAGLSAQSGPRVFVKESSSWQLNNGGGARPQTAEIIKTFHERCPRVTVTMKEDNADFVVELDHEGGKDFFLRRNKVVVFDNKSGDAFFSESTRSLGNAVKDACEAIKKRVP
jgi:hypothetical protein